MQSLSVCQFPKELCEVFAEALKRNGVLKSFKVMGNTGMALAGVVMHHDTLESIEVGYYDDSVLLVAMADAMKHNHTLKFFCSICQ